jgi:pimeloyl-ACP methyl ester carboxylesterase
LKVLGIIAVILLVIAVLGWLAVRGPDIPYATLDAKYADSASHFVDLPGGYHVHYQDESAQGQGTAPGAAGSGSLPLLVLLHGFGDSYTSWEGWARELKTRRRIISVDFPGHGLTRAPAGTVLRIDSLADFVDSFAAALALPKFAVAGNSMGGGVAWQLAVRHPDRISALILVDAAGFANDKPPAEVPLAFRILRYPIGRAILRNIDNRFLIRDGLRTDVYDKSLITPAFVDRWAEFQRAPGHRAILMSVNFGGQPADLAATLGTIKVPTLILWGDADPLLEPASAHKFAAAIPGSKLITYPQVGHLPQIEIPARSAADVGEFLDSIAAAPAPTPPAPSPPAPSPSAPTPSPPAPATPAAATPAATTPAAL